ncbi:hypothetical protein ACTJIJ_17615 [Niabella sp. 22666]|uniref:hypothetical protein n=1 Tax=Niabella sp. 22666 TaxID=3453954 RepID=UPI003F85919F
MRSWLIYFSTLMIVPSIHAQHASSAGQPHTSNDVVAVDQFGRSFAAIEGYRPGKQVGIFYWPWIGQPYATGIYDATVISALPNGLKLLYDFKHLNDSISPTGQAHFWGQPLWGYYNSADEWVIRRQMAMLATAGVDFIVFDLTNRVTYKSVYEKVLRIINELQSDGWVVPKAVFYTHSKSFETTWQLYNDLYKPNLYPEAWYRVGGKPMIIAYTNESDDIAEAMSRNDSSYRPVAYSKAIKDFFYFKKPQWPGDSVYQDGFPWIEWKYPQPLHGNTMSVSVASHPKVPMSRSITSGWINWGRGWDPGTQKNKKEDILTGGFFQKQWDHALKVSPDTIFVGGWNEWIAYKQPYGDEYMLCDAADIEFSRDIEPMRGGYGDAFYIQLIKNIRAYKGITDSHPGYAPFTINIFGATAQWAAVKAIYRNINIKAGARDHYGASKKIAYAAPAPANNLQEVRVAHDTHNFYFLIRADQPFVQVQDSAGLFQLLIGTDAPAIKGWNGYEYVIEPDWSTGKAQLSRLDKSRKKIIAGNIRWSVQQNMLQIEVPGKLIATKNKLTQIYFKVADGVAKPSDIMEYYVTGSVMPLGRLSFVYKLNR